MSGEFEGRRILVWGLGAFGGGEGAARFLAREGAAVVVRDAKGAEALQPALDRLAGLPIRFESGDPAERDFLAADLVVVNPAIPPRHPERRALVKSGAPWTTEMNLFLERCPARTLGVTGTNGKSTTASLVARLLSAAGCETFLGGNIGTSLLPALGGIRSALALRAPREVAVVLELSSFQLKDLDAAGRGLDVAAVTNLSENHLDYHGSLEAYATAKRRILDLQDSTGAAILNDDDPATRGWPVKGKRLGFGATERSFARALPDRIVLEGKEVPVEGALLPGMHNRLNMAAAAASALAWLETEAPPAAWGEALRTFAGLPHRLELVGERNGVRFYNDSKATTPEAALTALSSFGVPVHLVAGGRNKGADLARFARAIAAERPAPVRVIATGECGPELRRELAALGRQDDRLVPDFEPAVRAAAADAHAGEVVLLSPGCASFDAFAHYEARGEAFRRIVNAL